MTRSSISFRAATRSLAFALAVLALGFGSAALRSDAAGDDAAPESPSALPVELLVVQAAGHYPVRELHAGRVQSRRVSELGFERAGRLVEVTHDQGDRVEAGVVLARLDTRELRARRREAIAQRERIQAELDLARSTTSRRQQLHETGVLSAQRFDETTYAEQSLDSQRAAAVAAIERLDVQIALSELRAPFAGTLAQRFADEGTVLQPGAPVLRLLEDANLEVHVGIPPSAASRLEPGSLHAIEVEGLAADARLHAILPTIDPDTRTLTAVFHLESREPGIRHGALARVSLESRVTAAGFWVPLSALAEGRRGLWTAYVAVPARTGLTAERRQVEIIHAEADRAFVRGTLADGDRVIAGGVHRIVPGMAVRASSEG
ncbi:MAG: efflux RND transporter periplasmic adaptor subunit [Myxococcota bacterium]|nr:efflux RND transporter periplasmic adaptor subunit [Myxococcota bacterium]